MAYVVTGATGQVGSAVVNYLLQHALPVRVVIRSEDKAPSFRSRHVEVVLSDLTDVPKLSKAFEGARAVFAMNPPAYSSPDLHLAASEVSKALATAIQSARVPRVVVLSSIGAERTSGTGNILTGHTLEEALKEVAPRVVMVRAASFTENWKGSIEAVKKGHSSVIGSFLQHLDRRIPHIATDDIGRVSAEFMIKPDEQLKPLTIVELEGPEDLSPNDVAALTGERLGKQVVAVAMDEQMMSGLLSQFGCSKTTADNWIEMGKGFDDGTISWINDPNVIRVKGNLRPKDVLQTLF